MYNTTRNTFFQGKKHCFSSHVLVLAAEKYFKPCTTQKKNKDQKALLQSAKKSSSLSLFFLEKCSILRSFHTTPGHSSLKKGSTKGQKIKQMGGSALSVVFKVRGKEGGPGVQGCLSFMQSQRNAHGPAADQAAEVQTAGSG